MKTYRAGDSIEDYCRACKTDRMHTVIAADVGGAPIRVACGYCRSEHNYRGGPRIDVGGQPPSEVPPPVSSSLSEFKPVIGLPERTTAAMAPQDASDLERLLRQVIREEAGLTPIAPAPKWRGGSLVLRPASSGLQEKTWPIETFFHKIVMLRNRLRNLEQHVNASDLPDDVKLKLHSYITGCYGTLTSFNVLFGDEADQFKGTGD